MKTTQEHQIPEEGHPNPDHCANSYTIQCCLKHMLNLYYTDTPDFNAAICNLLGYITENHPSTSSIVNWLVHQKKHSHLIAWTHKTTLEEAKQALLIIINTKPSQEICEKQKIKIFENFVKKLPEFREVLGIEIAA